MTAPASPTDSPREVILRCADACFADRGFRKTTVAEIARAAHMSPANLYRHFESKHRIGAACCEGWMDQRLRRLREFARGREQSAAQRLEAFILENLRITHSMVTDQPHIHEMVEDITAREPELVHRKVDAMVSLFAEIIAFGNETGEFSVDDVVVTARTVYASQILFEVPIFTHLYPYEFFAESARDLARLLVTGLGRRET